MSLLMLPILLEYRLFPFTCCNQTPKCRENKTAQDGSKVTSSDSFLCHMKFNYIHCFYYSKYTGSPSTQQEILLYSLQYSFYAERKEVCWRGEKSCISLPSPTRRYEAEAATLISQAQLFHCASPPQQHASPRDTGCLNTTHLMHSLKLSQFHSF